MTDTEKVAAMRAQIAFDAALTVGQRVMARWTNCGNYYARTGTIVKVNRGSVRVELTNPYGGWPAGHVVSVPRMSGGRRGINPAYDCNHGAFPIK